MCTITTDDVIVTCVLSPLMTFIVLQPCIVCQLTMKLNSQTREIPNISLQLQNKNANQILKWNWTRSLTLPMTLPFDVQTVFHADANRFVVLLYFLENIVIVHRWPKQKCHHCKYIIPYGKLLRLRIVKS